MAKKIQLFVSIVFIFCVSSYAGAEEKSSSTLVDKKKYEWVVEEILQQIKSLRSEINSLKQDVTALNNKVDKLAKPKPAVAAKRTAPTKVDLGPNRLGDKNAQYAIIEFSDYQCPYCGRHVTNVLPQIKKELIDTGRVQYVLRDYPLSFHGAAKGAAIAARCAGQQDQYWAMHAALFANQRQLNTETYIDSAKTIGLKAGTFVKCINDPKQGEAVDQDLAYGNSLGVTGTPKFFVGKIQGETITNVVTISGAQSYGAFSGALLRLQQQALGFAKRD